MDGIVYLDLLEQYVFPQIETFEKEIVSKVFLCKMEPFPISFALWLTFQMRVSLMPGLEGVDQYPGHLEAQIPLDLIFFLWGYIKNILYAEKIRNIHHLQERITSAIETLTRDMIQKTWQEIEFGLDVSRAINDAHIEMY